MGFRTTGANSDYGFKTIPNESVKWGLYSADGKYFGDVSYGAYKAAQEGKLSSYTPKSNEKDIINKFKSHRGFALTSNDGTTLGNVSYDAYNAIQNFKLDDYLSKATKEEKEILNNFKKNTKVDLYDSDGKSHGKISYEGYVAIANGKFDSYKAKNDEEKATLASFKKTAEEKAKQERINSNPVFKRYNIDPADFDWDDLVKWAGEHNHYMQVNPTTMETSFKPEYKGGFLGIGGKKLSTDQEDADMEVLYQLASNQLRYDLSQKDLGAVMSGIVGFVDGLTFGASTALTDWKAERQYKKSGLSTDYYVSPSDSHAKTISEHQVANIGGNIVGGIISTKGVSGIVSAGLSAAKAPVLTSKAGTAIMSAVNKSAKTATWLSKSAPWMKEAIRDGITFGITSGTRTAFEGGTFEEVLSSSLRGGVSGAVGGALSKKAETAINSLLTNPKYANKFWGNIKDKASTYYAKNFIVGLVDATGDNVTDALIAKITGAKPRSTADIVMDFGITLGFGMLRTAANTKNISQANKNRIEYEVARYIDEYDAMNNAAKKATSVEGFAELGEAVINRGNNLKKFLQENIFTGNEDVVKSVNEKIDYVNTRVREKIAEARAKTTADAGADTTATATMPKAIDTTVSVGETFKESNTNKLIKVVDRNDTSTTVEITANGKTETKQVPNNTADRLATEDRYNKLETTPEPTESATPTPIAEDVTTKKTINLKRWGDNYEVYGEEAVALAEELGAKTETTVVNGVETEVLRVPADKMVEASKTMEDEFNFVFSDRTTNENSPVTNKNVTTEETTPIAEESATEVKIIAVTNAVDETLYPEARKGVLDGVADEDKARRLSEFAGALTRVYEKSGSLGNMAQYFSDNGAKVIAAIEGKTEVVETTNAETPTVDNMSPVETSKNNEELNSLYEQRNELNNLVEEMKNQGVEQSEIDKTKELADEIETEIARLEQGNSEVTETKTEVKEEAKTETKVEEKAVAKNATTTEENSMVEETDTTVRSYVSGNTGTKDTAIVNEIGTDNVVKAIERDKSDVTAATNSDIASQTIEMDKPVEIVYVPNGKGKGTYAMYFAQTKDSRGGHIASVKSVGGNAGFDGIYDMEFVNETGFMESVNGGEAVSTTKLTQKSFDGNPEVVKQIVNDILENKGQVTFTMDDVDINNFNEISCALFSEVSKYLPDSVKAKLGFKSQSFGSVPRYVRLAGVNSSVNTGRAINIDHFDTAKGKYVDEITKQMNGAQSNSEALTNKSESDTMKKRTSETQNSLERKEVNNEQGREGLLHEDGKRRNNESTRKHVGDILSNGRRNESRTAKERKSFARELIERGQTEQVTVEDNTFELVNPEAYNDEMKAMVEKAQSKGKELGFFVGEGTLTVVREDGTVQKKLIDGVKTSDGKIYIQYDADRAPQILYDHEYCHSEWDTPEMQKAANTILGSLTEREKEAILSAPRYKTALDGYTAYYKGDVEKAKKVVWEEFVCDVMSRMNDYGSKFQDVVSNYWNENESADTYKVAEYTESTDAGGDGKFSFSSMGATFFGDENLSAKDFEKMVADGSYKTYKGYQDFVKDCVNVYKKSRGFKGMLPGTEVKKIEKQIEGIMKVAVAAKKAGYDIYDDGKARSIKDSKKRLLFSSLEPNSDYVTSSDVSTICDKAKNFTEIYDGIVKIEEERNVPADKRFFNNVDNYFILHKLLADKGLTIPCDECYVQALRKNLTPMANAFVELVTEENSDNKENAQLYHQDGKDKGNVKKNNAEIREKVRELLSQSDCPIKLEDLSLKMLTTADGLTELRLEAPLVYEAFNSFYGQSKPKMPKKATPFRPGELIAMFTNSKGEIKTSLVNKIKATGGFRLQSYGDFQIENYVDVLQTIFEASMVGLNGHAYTKVPAFLEATDGTNLKRNISIFMYEDNGDWKLDKKNSFPMELEDIYSLVASDKSGNTGIIAVSQNEDMSAWIMANELLGYGIPFHKSATRMDVVRSRVVKTPDGRKILGYQNQKDHTKQQTEVYSKTLSDKQKENTKVKKPINIYSFWDFKNKDNLSKNELIEKNLKKYIDECNKRDYRPKFREYVMDNEAILDKVLYYAKRDGFVPQNATVDDISFKHGDYTIPYGYHKFLGDFGMFTPDGKAVPIETLSLENYDFDKAVDFFKDSSKLRTNELLQQFENGKVRDEYREKIEKGELTTEQLENILKEKRSAVIQKVVNGTDDSTKGELTSPEWNEFYRSLGELERGLWFPQTADGDFIFETANKLIFNDGNYNNPQINSVVVFEGLTDDEVEYGKETAYYAAQRGQNSEECYEVVRDMLGQAFVTRTNPYPDKAYQGSKDNRGKRKHSVATDSKDNSKLRLSFAEKAETEYAPTFYSHMGKTIDGMKQDKIGANSVVSYLTGRGVKAEEIKWSGIETFLDGKKSVTKAELQEFVASNQFKIEETVLGDGESTTLKPSAYEPEDLVVMRGSKVYDTLAWNETDKVWISDAYGYHFTSEENIRNYYGVNESGTRWGDYKLDGGENYREILFKIPDSSYSNAAMRSHWGNETEGVVAHARIQDFNVDGNKRLFVEEIQSDWHNQGHKFNYESDISNEEKNKHKILKDKIENAKAKYDSIHKEKNDLAYEYFKLDKMSFEEYGEKAMPLITAEEKAQRELNRLVNEWNKINDKIITAIPDAPYRDNYHEYVLKHLIRMAAEQGYDSIGWTTADIQSDRWSDDYAEGYRIEYDQDIPKFLNKYGKKWGAKVGKDYLGDSVETVYEIVREEGVRGDGRTYATEGEAVRALVDETNRLWGTDFSADNVDVMSGADSIMVVDADIGEVIGEINLTNRTGTEVWSMPITDSMKESVLYEGQPRYSFAEKDNLETQKKIESIAEDIGSHDELVEYAKKNTKEFVAKIKENKSLQTRLDNAKRQTSLSPTPVVNVTKAGNITKEILNEMESTLKATDLRDEVMSIYNEYFDAMKKAKNVKSKVQEANDNMLERFGRLAVDIVDSSVAYTESEEYELLKSYVKNTRINIPEDAKGEAHYAEFRKSHMGTFNLTNDGLPIDRAYQELCELFPGLFSEEVTAPADQLNAIAEALETTKPYAYNPHKSYMEDAREHVVYRFASEVDGLAVVPKTKAQKIAEKGAYDKNMALDKERTEFARKLDKHKEQSENTIRKLQKKIDDAKYVGYWEKRLSKEEKAQALKELRDKRDIANLKSKIRNIVSDMKKNLDKTEKAGGYPKELVKAAADVCSVLDFHTDRTGKNGSPTKASLKLDALKMQYDALKNNPNYDLASEYNEDLSDKILKLNEAISGKRVIDLNKAELTNLKDILSEISTRLSEASKQIGQANAKANIEIATEIINSMKLDNKAISEIRNQLLKEMRLAKESGKAFVINPHRIFEMIANYDRDSAWWQLYDQILRGSRNAAKFTMDATVPFDELTDGAGNEIAFYDFRTKTHKTGIKYQDGTDVELPKSIICELVMLWDRKQGRNHLETGGVKIPDLKLFNKGKTADALASGKMTNAITQADITRLKGMLDSYDKAWIEKSRHLFNKVAKDAINGVSMQLVGREIAKADNYIRIYVDSDFVKKDIGKDESDITIEGHGSLKETTPDAKNPLVVRGLHENVYEHIDFAAKYYGLAIPIRNFNKVYKISINNKGNFDSVKNALGSVYGPKIRDGVVVQVIKDLQAPRHRELSVFNKVKGGWLGATFWANIRSTLKQTTSYWTSSSILDEGSLVKGLASYVAHRKQTKAEIDKYSGTLYKRSQGLSTTELGDRANRKRLAGLSSKTTKLINTKLPILRKIPEWIRPGNWLQSMDCAVSSALWEACKHQVSKTMKATDDGFMEAVRDLYERVIEETQSNYDMLHRPEILKSTNMTWQTVGMFQNDNLQQTGIMYSALGDLRAKKKAYKANKSSANEQKLKDAKKRMGKAVRSRVYSSVWLVAVSMLGDAILRKFKPYIDDEEKEISANSVLEQAMLNMSEDMLGVAFPVVGQLATKAMDTFGEGYDFLNDPAFDVLEDFIKATSKIYKAYDEDGDVLKAWTDAIPAISNMTGIPAKNISDLYNGIKGYIGDIKAGEFAHDLTDYSGGKSFYNYGDLASYIVSGDKEKEKKLLDYYSENGKEIAKGSLTQEIKPAYVQMYIDSPKEAYNLKRKLILEYDYSEETIGNWTIAEYFKHAIPGKKYDDDVVSNPEYASEIASAVQGEKNWSDSYYSTIRSKYKTIYKKGEEADTEALKKALIQDFKIPANDIRTWESSAETELKKKADKQEAEKERFK